MADTTYVAPDAATLAFTTINVFWSVPLLILTGVGLMGMRRWGFLLGIGQFFMINYGNTYDFLVDYWDGFSRVRNVWIVLAVGMIQFTSFSFALLYASSSTRTCSLPAHPPRSRDPQPAAHRSPQLQGCRRPGRRSWCAKSRCDRGH